MKKTSVPDVPFTPDSPRRMFDQAVRENINVITGKQGGKIAPLSETATTAQIIAKINELLTRLQG